MHANRFRVAALFAAFALCAFAPAARGQQPSPSPTPDNFVNHTSFKSRVFEVRHRDPEQLSRVLQMLTSGHKGAGVSFNRAFRTITVRDFPENIVAVEDALKRLDTPEPARPEVELHLHVLLASNAEGGGTVPPVLRDVVTQLQSTLSFRHYQLLTTIIQRAKVTEQFGNVLNGEGSAQLAAAPGGGLVNYRYSFFANTVSQTTSAAGVPTLQLGTFGFTLDGGEAGGKASVRSDVGIREGEKVVVGTAGLRDKALILVVTARPIK